MNINVTGKIVKINQRKMINSKGGQVEYIDCRISVDRGNAEKRHSYFDNKEYAVDFYKVTFLGNKAKSFFQYAAVDRHISISGRLLQTEYYSKKDNTIIITPDNPLYNYLGQALGQAPSNALAFDQQTRNILMFGKTLVKDSVIQCTEYRWIGGEQQSQGYYGASVSAPWESNAGNSVQNGWNTSAPNASQGTWGTQAPAQNTWGTQSQTPAPAPSQNAWGTPAPASAPSQNAWGVVAPAQTQNAWAPSPAPVATPAQNNWGVQTSPQTPIAPVQPQVPIQNGWDVQTMPFNDNVSMGQQTENQGVANFTATEQQNPTVSQNFGNVNNIADVTNANNFGVSNDLNFVPPLDGVELTANDINIASAGTPAPASDTIVDTTVNASVDTNIPVPENN